MRCLRVLTAPGELANCGPFPFRRSPLPTPVIVAHRGHLPGGGVLRIGGCVPRHLRETRILCGEEFAESIACCPVRLNRLRADCC